MKLKLKSYFSQNGARLGVSIKNGATCRNRTDDPRFTKPLLYQLS